MHSTSSLQTDAEFGSPSQPRGRASGRGRGNGSGKKTRKARMEDSMIDGFPTFESLRPVINFLIFPTLLVLGITITGGHWPKVVLYPIALLMGLYVAWSAFKGVELVLAVLLLYMPFSPVYVIPIAPGVNGTNALMGLALIATIVQAQNSGKGWINWLPGTTLMLSFAFFSSLSGVTILFHSGGYEWLVHHHFYDYKGWVDQFLVYLIALSSIRDHATAKRVFLYLCLGSMIVVMYALPEMFDKMGRSSIEKSRVEGPLRQSNDFGGFVAYTTTYIIAIFLAFFHSVRAWLITPYFIFAFKLLIATFSRGAYIAMAVGGIMAAYLKGKGFLIFGGMIGLTLILLFPSLVPESIMNRINASFADKEATSGPQKLDKSSEHRLILWKAAGDMVLESPIQGKGFKGFAKLKSQYTERPVHESDPHNFYLYVAAQMGVPVLVMFLFVLAFAFHSGRVLSRNKVDRTARAIGIAGAASTVVFAAVCMFGSRAVSPEYSAYYFVLFVIMQVLRSDDHAKTFYIPGKGTRGAKVPTQASGLDDIGPAVGVTGDLAGATASRRIARKAARQGAGSAKPARRGVAAQRAANDVSVLFEAEVEPSTDSIELDEADEHWNRPGKRTSRKSGRRRTNAFEQRDNLRRGNE